MKFKENKYISEKMRYKKKTKYLINNISSIILPKAVLTPTHLFENSFWSIQIIYIDNICGETNNGSNVRMNEIYIYYISQGRQAGKKAAVIYLVNMYIKFNFSAKYTRSQNDSISIEWMSIGE